MWARSDRIAVDAKFGLLSPGRTRTLIDGKLSALEIAENVDGSQSAAPKTEDSKMAMSSKSSPLQAMILNVALPWVLLAGVSILTAGCKTAGVPASQPAARADQQVAADIQAKLAVETALTGQSIQVDVQSGVATLSGAVSDNASRSLAGNDAGTVTGVRTVVNNLMVQSASVPSNPSPASSTPLQYRGTKPAPERYGETRNQATQAHRSPSTNDSQNQNPQNQSMNQGPQQNTSSVPTPPPAPTAETQPPPVAVNVTVPDGTVFPVRITEALDSSQAQVDDVFHGTLAQDLIIDGMVAIPRGAAVMGRVVDARDAGHFKGSSLLSVELTQVTSHGRQIPVTTSSYSKEGKARGTNTAEKAGGGAAIGAIIGAIAGGGKGAAIGAAAGGGLGAGSNGVTRGQQVQIASETIINFRLQSPVTVTTSRKAGAPRANEQDMPQPTLQQR